MAKYKFYVNGNMIVCVSHYAGKSVRGIAKCSPEDNFDLEFGKRLAKARCDLKVADKRMDRAIKTKTDLAEEREALRVKMHKANEYYDDARDQLFDAEDAYYNLLDTVAAK